MSLMMVGSLNTYANNMKMQMKWEQKRAKGDYSADGTTSITDQLRKEASGIGTAANRRSSQTVMNGIRAKLNAGKRLSSSELEYLKENDPETYQHVKTMEMERKAYEQRLRSCKTKEDVQRLKAAHMAASLDRVKEVNNNPNIPAGEKLKLTLQEHQKATSVANATTRFVESGEYHKLPTEAEKRKAEKDLKEAKEAEMKGETKDEKDRITDEEETKSEAVENEEAVRAEEDREQGTTEAAARTAGEAARTDASRKPSPADAADRVSHAKPADGRIAKARKLRLAAKMTRVEAELTPEAQKVRRSKAKAAYVRNMYSGEADSSAIIDIRK